MARKIYKHQLSLPLWVDEFRCIREKMMLPKGARVLSVQLSKGVPCLWISAAENSPLEKRVLHIVPDGGTDHLGVSDPDPQKGCAQYIGSTPMETDGDMHHVFIC